MLHFKTPELSDRRAVSQAVNESSYGGSDASFGNIYLLRKKYGTEIAMENGALFRYYNGKGSRRGYTFPLSSALRVSDDSCAGAADECLGIQENSRIFENLQLIEQHALDNGRSLEFCLVTDDQLKILRQYFQDRVVVEENRGDSDYIYSAESLATLEGGDYCKKRNHFSKFKRAYGDYELRPIVAENSADALYVEKLWLIESGSIDNSIANDSNARADDVSAECSEDSKSRCAEFDSIAEALRSMDCLGFKGAILYVNGNPAGMTMATEISAGVWDIHFEKVIGEYAENGGYAAINKLFAESLGGVGLINREEDINIEGLRMAKLSYHPLVILHKYHVKIESL